MSREERLEEKEKNDRTEQAASQCPMFSVGGYHQTEECKSL